MAVFEVSEDSSSWNKLSINFLVSTRDDVDVGMV